MNDEEKFTREELEKAMVDAKRLLNKMDDVVGVLYAVCPHCGYPFKDKEEAVKPGPCPGCGKRGEPVVIKHAGSKPE